MDNKQKKRVGIISFLPFLAWSVCFAYFMIINKQLIDTARFQDHDLVVNNVQQHFMGLFIYMLIAVLITAGVIYFYVIHLAKLKNLTAGEKIGWIVFMFVFGALAFPVMWYFEIRKEPKNAETYPDIG